MRPAAAVLCAGLLAAACEREIRPFQDLPTATAESRQPVGTPLYAGPQAPPESGESPYQQNAYGMAEGKRLFTSLNCSGCHANGGGGMGPALMDDEWIYGSRPENIFESIVQGRPNGMPTWRNKVTDQQVWQLVAYVQSMSGQAPQDAMPGRSDHMRSSTPENARRSQTPVQTGAQ